MNGELPLFSVSRMANGWLVRLHQKFGPDRVIACLTWEEVEKACRRAAFPFVDPNDPVMP